MASIGDDASLRDAHPTRRAIGSATDGPRHERRRGFDADGWRQRHGTSVNGCPSASSPARPVLPGARLEETVTAGLT